MVITKKERKRILTERIKKGIGAWKISLYKSGGKKRIGFHNKKGRFITHIPQNDETERLMRVYAKKVIIEGRLKGIRPPQMFQINYYSQEQATSLGKKVRKGLAPLKKDKTKRDIDLLLDKYKFEYLSDIKYTS